MKSSSIKELRKLLESEVEQAESIIAARGFSQELQSMIEKLGRLVNEDLPAVSEQMRISLGADTATAFENQTVSVIQNVMDQLRSGKQDIDNSVAAIGEGRPLDDSPSIADDDLEDELLDLDVEGDEDPLGGLDDEELDDLPAEPDDEMDASPLGRERKESIERSNSEKIVESDGDHGISKREVDLARQARAYRKARQRGERSYTVDGRTYKIVGDIEDLAEMDRKCEAFLSELIHFDDLESEDSKSPQHGEDELKRRQDLKRGWSKDKELLSVHGRDYKEKDRYGDGYKIKGPKGKLPEDKNELPDNFMFGSMEEFYDYVLSFYGTGGLYDIDATREEVEKATEILRKQRDYMPPDGFVGDSIDRENIRDIITDRLRG